MGSMLFTRHLHTFSTVCVLVTLLSAHSDARPYKDSPITTIVVPYQPNGNAYPLQFLKALIETRGGIGPAARSSITHIPALSSAAGLNDGAYTADPSSRGHSNPIYYMPSNANGKFGGKISLLK